MALFSATVASAKVAATLTDYPAYIDLSEMPASFWSTVSNGGGDIRVYSDEAKTTELAREVVSCDTDTDTGELHVKIPSLTTSTVIYIDVDGTRSEPAADSTYGSEAVWSEYNFASNDGGLTDSTGNASPTNNGATPVTGRIGAALSYDGTDDYVDIGSLGDFGSNLANQTAQMLIRTEDTRSDRLVAGSLNTGNTTAYYFLRLNEDSTGDISNWLRNNSAAANRATVTPDVYDGEWHWITVKAIDTTTQSYTIYIDGVGSSPSTENNVADSFSNFAFPFYLGAAANRGGGALLHAEVDINSVRFIKGGLSDDWIETEYNNQSDPATFWSIEEVGSAPIRNPLFSFGGI